MVIPPVNDNLEATAQAVFQDQFASYYGCDKLPEGYSIVSLDSLCTVKGGKRLPADCELLDDPTEHPYIRVRDVGGVAMSVSQTNSNILMKKRIKPSHDI